MAAGWILETAGLTAQGEHWVRRYIAAVDTEQEARAAVETFAAKAGHSAKGGSDSTPSGGSPLVAKPASEAVMAFVALTPGQVMRWN